MKIHLVKPLIDRRLLFNIIKNTRGEVKREILILLGANCEKYLGLLMASGKSKVNMSCLEPIRVQSMRKEPSREKL